jgi:hypothetical protein
LRAEIGGVENYREGNPWFWATARSGPLVSRDDEIGMLNLEGGAAQRLVAGLAPPFDRRVGHAPLREVVRQHFRLGPGSLGEAVAQDFGDNICVKQLPTVTA